MATMLSKLKKAAALAGRRLIVKIGKEKREIEDTELAEIIDAASSVYYDMKALEPALKDYKNRIASKAKSLIDDKGTVTFITDSGIECRVTFQYEALIPEEHIEKAKALLGDRFSDLVRVKTVYQATPKLIELATDADYGRELSEVVIVREKAAQITIKK